ncbi:hypothetical protein [Persicitalea sp.]|uniref:hypothetical protein n=1 Tax=Persicitalea sp. TaxID=3100273 RepID=UPI0035949344
MKMLPLLLLVVAGTASQAQGIEQIREAEPAVRVKLGLYTHIGLSGKPKEMMSGAFMFMAAIPIEFRNRWYWNENSRRSFGYISAGIETCPLAFRSVSAASPRSK